MWNAVAQRYTDTCAKESLQKRKSKGLANMELITTTSTAEHTTIDTNASKNLLTPCRARRLSIAPAANAINSAANTYIPWSAATRNAVAHSRAATHPKAKEIGRASCRERV